MGICLDLSARMFKDVTFWKDKIDGKKPRKYLSIGICLCVVYLTALSVYKDNYCTLRGELHYK
jgi:hypothetical protein